MTCKNGWSPKAENICVGREKEMDPMVSASHYSVLSYFGLWPQSRRKDPHVPCPNGLSIFPMYIAHKKDVYPVR